MFSALSKKVNSNRAARGMRCLSRSVFILAVVVAVQMLPAVRLFSESLEDVLGRSNYSASQKEVVRGLFRAAREDKVPEELLLPRLAEGVAKRVPAEKVLDVLQQNLSQLGEARSILLGVSGGAVLLQNRSSWLRTANLLAAGVPAVEIREIAEACRHRPQDYRQASALHVSLVAWGLAVPESLSLVKAFLESTIPGESFAGVLELLAAGRRLRIPPEELTRRIREELPRADSLEQLQERILYE